MLVDRLFCFEIGRWCLSAICFDWLWWTGRKVAFWSSPEDWWADRFWFEIGSQFFVQVWFQDFVGVLLVDRRLCSGGGWYVSWNIFCGIMFHEYPFVHTHIVQPSCESVWEIQKVSFLCVCWDHVNRCHNCMWVYKWYMPPKVVYVSLPFFVCRCLHIWDLRVDIKPKNNFFCYGWWLRQKMSLHPNF